MIASIIHPTGRREGFQGFSPEAAPSSSANATFSPRQTEALLPSEMIPARTAAVDNGHQQEVEGQRQEQSRLAEQIREAAERANRYMKRVDTHLEFRVGEQTGRVVIKVVDSATEEVVREIPPEQMQRIAEQLTEMRGLLFETQG